MENKNTMTEPVEVSALFCIKDYMKTFFILINFIYLFHEVIGKITYKIEAFL